MRHNLFLLNLPPTDYLKCGGNSVVYVSFEASFLIIKSSMIYSSYNKRKNDAIS